MWLPLWQGGTLLSSDNISVVQMKSNDCWKETHRSACRVLPAVQSYSDHWLMSHHTLCHIRDGILRIKWPNQQRLIDSFTHLTSFTLSSSHYRETSNYLELTVHWLQSTTVTVTALQSTHTWQRLINEWIMLFWPMYNDLKLNCCTNSEINLINKFCSRSRQTPRMRSQDHNTAFVTKFLT